MYVAISGDEIVFKSDSKQELEGLIDKLCSLAPDLFYRPYITVMSYEDYLKEDK